MTLSADQALLTLLHVLVFAYWLGGDLGAFYSSRFLTKPGVSADRRLLAAKIVGDVDMAPRTALMLALPTGLLLARESGYITLDWTIIWGVSAGFLCWLALVWLRHLRHGELPRWTRTFDLALRWLVLASLIALAVAAFTGHADWPLFLAIKLLLLAAAVALGLMIRGVLSPLGPALASLSGPEAPSGEATLNRLMGIARPMVMAIWACLLAAAFVGLWKPV
jgi:hypothetical protein